jgi:formate dehydrogenase subunit beta
MQGTTIKYSDSDLNSAVKKIVVSLLDGKCIDAVIAPKRIPSGESFAYEITNNVAGVEDLCPFPPVVPINGARALKHLTRKGALRPKILCIMRPCEIRASVELFKLRQVDLSNIMFLSIDCPGALPTKDYIVDAKKCDDSFSQTLETYQNEGLRPSCQICLHFENTSLVGDIHIAKIGLPEKTLMVIPCSEQGKTCLTAIGFSLNEDSSSWRVEIDKKRQQREEQRKTAFADIAGRTRNIDDLNVYFADCINCHNCMRVCPICYCRQCFFDSSDATRIEAESYLLRADKTGGIAFPPDKLLFHLGRMSHMSLSCIGCGACEDSCALDVPVAQIFSYIAEKEQQMFNYVPGRNVDEHIPVLTYEENELHEYEDAKGQS